MRINKVSHISVVTGAALGMFLLATPTAQAWTDAEITHCAKYNHDGGRYLHCLHFP